MKRKIIAISAAAVCLLLLLFFVCPMDMGSLTGVVRWAYVAHITSEVEVRDYAAFPINEINDVMLESGSPEFDEFMALLEQTEFHRVPGTLLGRRSHVTGMYGDRAEIWLYGTDAERDYMLVVYESGDVFINYTRYDMGYFSSGPEQEFIRNIYSLIT